MRMMLWNRPPIWYWRGTICKISASWYSGLVFTSENAVSLLLPEWVSICGASFHPGGIPFLHLMPVEQMWLYLSGDEGAECMGMLRQVWYLRTSCGQHMFRWAFWSPGIQAEGLSPSVHEALPAQAAAGMLVSVVVDWDGSREVTPAGLVLGVPFGLICAVN